MNESKESKAVTVRIPPDWLERIEALAEKRYPSRSGKGGNRSQIILDAIEAYLSSEESSDDDNVHFVTKDELEGRLTQHRLEVNECLEQFMKRVEVYLSRDRAPEPSSGEYLTDSEVRERTGKSDRTLRRWKSDGKSPDGRYVYEEGKGWISRV